MGVIRLLARLLIAIVLILGVYLVQYNYGPEPGLRLVLWSPERVAPGTETIIRVRVSSFGGDPVQGAVLSLALKGNPRNTQASSGVELSATSDSKGMAMFKLTVPDLEDSTDGGEKHYQMVVSARHGKQRETVEKKIAASRPLRIFIESDREIYRPGQEIQYRALVFDPMKFIPAGNSALQVEILDPAGKVLDRKTERTSDFGLISGRFQTQNSSQMGSYTIRASAGVWVSKRQFSLTSLRLPDLLVHLETNASWICPGGTIKSVVRASWPNGAPSREAILTGSAMACFPTGNKEVASISGRTDETGTWEFTLVLPKYAEIVNLAGPGTQTLFPLPLHIEVRAEAPGGVLGSASSVIPILRYPIIVSVRPEGGSLVEGVTNRVFVITSLPDGTPVQSTLRIGRKGESVATDDLGTAEILIIPEGLSHALDISASTAEGFEGLFSGSMAVAGGPGSISLELEKHIITEGGRVSGNIHSREEGEPSVGKEGMDYIVNLLKEGQCVSTAMVERKGRVTPFTMALPDSARGFFEISVHDLSSPSGISVVSRCLFARPDNDLCVSASSDRVTYRPGETALVEFTAREHAGKDGSESPSDALLGVSVIDERAFKLWKDRKTLARGVLHFHEGLIKFSKGTRFTPGGDDLESFTALKPADSGKSIGEDRDQRIGGILMSTLPRIHSDDPAALTPLEIHGRNSMAAHSRSLRMADNFSLFAGYLLGLLFLLNLAYAIGMANETGDYKKYFRASKKDGSVDFEAPSPYIITTRPNWEANLECHNEAASYFFVVALLFLIFGAMVPASEGFKNLFAEQSILSAFLESLKNAEPWAVGSVAALATGTMALYFYLMMKKAGAMTDTGQFIVGSGLLTIFLYVSSSVGFTVLSRFLDCSVLIPTAVDLMAILIPVSLFLGLDALQGSEADTASGGPRGLNLFTLIRKTGDLVFFDSSILITDGGCGYLMVFGLITIVAIAALTATGGSVRSIFGTISGAVSVSGGDTTAITDIMGSSAAEVSTHGQRDVPISVDDSLKSIFEGDVMRPREYFPETLLFEPALLTGSDGKAELRLSLPDSITRWMVSALAIDRKGGLGYAVLPLKTTQDLALYMARPPTLTVGDRLLFPVGVTSMTRSSGEPLSVTIAMKSTPNIRVRPAEGRRVDPSHAGKAIAAEQVVTIQAGGSGETLFEIEALEPGPYSLEAWAGSGKSRDALKHCGNCLPRAVRTEERVNGWLREGLSITLSQWDPSKPDAPTGVSQSKDAYPVFPGCAEVVARVYPGSMSHVIGGLEGLLRMPTGCFEQTTSTNYPNIMVLDYLKKSGRISDELSEKSLGFLRKGYERLAGFEVNGGGFSLFGSPPAKVELTAYGLLQFKEMARHVTVDEAMMGRTLSWILSQKGMGWMNGRDHRRTAFVLWCLTGYGYEGPEVLEALESLHEQIRSSDSDPYFLALTGMSSARMKRRSFNKVCEEIGSILASMGAVGKDTVSWSPKGPTMTGSYGKTSIIETTSLVISFALEAGANGIDLEKSRNYLFSSRQHDGSWGSTWSTVLALKALTQDLDVNSTNRAPDEAIDVFINDKIVKTLWTDRESRDIPMVIDLTEPARQSLKEDQIARLTVKARGTLLNLPCQFSLTRHDHGIWGEGIKGSMRISAAVIDAGRNGDGIAKTLRASIAFTDPSGRSVSMPMVIVPIVPGFDTNPRDLNRLLENSCVRKYELRDDEIAIYLDSIQSGAPPVVIDIPFSGFRGGRVTVRPLRVYDYYDPDTKAFSPPIELEVQ